MAPRASKGRKRTAVKDEGAKGQAPAASSSGPDLAAPAKEPSDEIEPAKTLGEDSGPAESVPEVVWDEDDLSASDDDDEESEEAGPVLDVGTTPSLPAMRAVDSRASVPAVRAREGITRRT